MPALASGFCFLHKLPQEKKLLRNSRCVSGAVIAALDGTLPRALYPFIPSCIPYRVLPGFVRVFLLSWAGGEKTTAAEK